MVTRNSSFDLDPTQNHEVYTVDGAPKPLAIPEFWQMASWKTGTVALPPALRAAVVHQNAQIQAAHLPIQHMFNAPLFSGQRHFPVPNQDREWYCMPLDEDPLWLSTEGLPMPEEVLARLEAMESAGIEFDTYYIAHELLIERQNTPTATLDRLRPQPSATAQRASAGLGSLATQLLNIARLPLMAATVGLAAGAALGASVATAGVGLALLDPILMGVIVDPDHGLKPGAPASWYYIAHWIYA